MRDAVPGIEAQMQAGNRATSVSGQQDNRVHTLAVYGAFALIAAIVFGTLPYHPF